MSSDNNPKYRWRIATRGDIGSVARFGDTDSEHEAWTYGILKAIEKCEMYAFEYVCEANCFLDEDERYLHCHVQYDANEEP